MLPLQPIFIFNFIFLLLPPLVSAGLVAKPGCPDRCGNLSIPYPFGIGSGCSLDPSFDISCDTSTVPPKAYITIIIKEVIEINETYFRVKYPNYVASACYGLSDNKSYGTAVDLSGTQYTLSSENWLTVIGCDDMVEGTGEGSLMDAGCASLCTGRNDTGGIGYCPEKDAGLDGALSNGCCRTPITGGSTFLRAQLSDLSGALVRRRLFPCSYAFIQETGSGNQFGFSYRLDFLLNNSKEFPNNEFMPPVVQLDWRIGYTNCSEELTNDPSYACRDKSVCSDLYDVAGYVCSCFQGYKGNPYLTGGCEAFSSSVAKPGCLDHCGNISIPFPFGVGPNCYKDSSFDVSCNLSSSPPTPYLSALNAEIFDLNLSQIQVNYPKRALACYNQVGEKKNESRSLIIDLTASQFTLSTQNVINTAGCDELVVAYGGPNRSFVSGSCLALCPQSNVLRTYGLCPYFYTSEGFDRYSSGFGCCQASISKGTSYLEAHLSDLSGQWRRKKLFPCSYAMVSAKNSYYYIYPLEYLNNSTTLYSNYYYSSVLPLVLDWRIGVENCKQAQSNLTNFACQDNSVCVDFDENVGGYLCNCLEGYGGNPYLVPGCQVDIDECADDTTNHCLSNTICTNTRGSYHCSCPEGYFGDGRKNSTGCIRGRDVLKLKTIILAGMGSGLGFVLLLIMSYWLHMISKMRKEKKIKEKFFNRNGGLLLKQQTDEGSLGKTNIFPEKELEVATDYFNESRILGQGGQGTVYKGMLSDGKIVAIKKSKLVEENQVQQFINEVVILSQINHRNVVRLLGCCLETEVPLLVYEFMPNGTLYELIHDPNNEFPFPWSTRLKIATDIAGALAYLHYACSMPIYHRDIKSSNILLDEKYVVKVSDFGTSRSISIDQTHLTTMVKGTFGYLDPEYFQSSQFTEKSDVYSFGVVLVELLTGLKPISFDKTEVERALATRFLACMEENCLHTILDPQVLEQGVKEEVILLASLAQRCLHMKGKMRPTMKEVANELESLRLSQMSTLAKDEYEDVRAFENIPFTISDIEYTWTASYKSAGASSSSDMHPLMFTTN